MNFKLTQLLGLLGLLALAAGLRAQSVNAGFQPEIIGVGEVGTYTVVLENFDLQGGVPRVNPPRVTGLKVLGLNPGTSQRTQYINGRMSSQVSLTWQVAAAAEGTYTVPSQPIVVGGRSYQIPPATLRVVPSNERNDGLFKLEWDVSDKTYYVGEAIPAFLKLYIRGDVRDPNLANLSVNVPDGLISSEDQPPEQSRERIDGVTYIRVTWTRTVTPIRPEDFTLEATATLEYQDPNSRRRSLDPFRMFSAGERKLVMAPDATIHVEEIPTDGRPEGFNGAVGNFETRTELESDSVAAGEPVTLQFIIEGTGNFDRIAAPEIPETEQWRIYPPKVSFEPGDAVGFKGTKTFEYLLIPADESVTETPAIPFASFDPYREVFEELSAQPLAIEVTPAPEGGNAVSFTQTPTAAETNAPKRPANTWRPFRADLGKLQDGVQPVVTKPSFLIVQGVLALAALALAGFRWQRRRLVDDEAYARKVTASKTVRRWLKEAETAAQAGKAEEFHSAAQRTVQEAVGRHFPRSRRAESLTLSEIETKLVELDLAAEHREAVAALFQAGDALRYAGLATDSAALRESHTRLEAFLRALR